jgi:histidyl-tRNA synthetase
MFGGGRYDNLVGLFVERNDISGVGFGLGDVTLENFLRTHNLIPDLGGRTLVLVTRFDDVPYEKYTAILSNLRNAGIAAMIFFGSKKLGKQLEYASKAGCTHAIIMGAGELAGGVVKIKDLGTREEQVVEYSRIAKYFGK